MKEIVKRALLGIAISLAIAQIITLIVSLCIHNGTYYPYYPILEKKYGGALGAMCVQTLVDIVYGIIFGVSTFIFSKDRWSLTRQTITHFLLITTSCLVGGWLAYWYPHKLSGVLIALAEYVVTYFIIWFCIYQSYKKSIEQINNRTSLMHSDQQAESE